MAVTESQVAALELEKVIPKVRYLFERDDKFYAHIKKRDVEKICHTDRCVFHLNCVREVHSSTSILMVEILDEVVGLRSIRLYSIACF